MSFLGIQVDDERFLIPLEGEITNPSWQADEDMDDMVGDRIKYAIPEEEYEKYEEAL